MIEDEQDLSAVAAAQLERLGCKVTAVYDLEQARELLQSNKFRLVISDHRLPDGAGIQFAAEMQPTLPKTKFVMISGCFSAKDLEFMETQDISYHHKPLLYRKIFEQYRNEQKLAAPVRIPLPQVQIADAPEEKATLVANAPKDHLLKRISKLGRRS